MTSTPPRPLSARLGAAVIAGVTAVLCAAGGARGAPPEPQPGPAATERQRHVEQALALHNEARACYQRGEYRAAIEKLQKAAALDPEGKELVYNLAVIHEKLGEIDAAEVYYRRYREMEIEPKEREQVDAVLRRLSGAKKELAPREPAPRPPPPPPPVAAPPADGGRPLAPWVIATGSFALGALVIGNVFAVSALARDPGSDAATGDGVSARDLQADASAAHRDAVIADVALIAAGIAGGAALYLYLSTPPRRAAAVTPAAPAPAVAPPRPFSRGPAPEQLGPGSPGDRGDAGGVRLSLGAAGARLEARF